MEDLDLDIPEFIDPDNFCIIYKGKKIMMRVVKKKLLKLKHQKKNS